MNNRRRVRAILHYEDYDRLPVVHFGFWRETLQKWREQGHITEKEAATWHDGRSSDKTIGEKLGFDFNWANTFAPDTGLMPLFERKTLEVLPDGFKKIVNANGVIELYRKGAGSIPAEVGYTLVDRKSWQEHYLPRLQFSEERITKSLDNTGAAEMMKNDAREDPVGIHCGSLFGVIRNWLGLENSCFLYMDDEPLYDEIIDTVANLCYRCTEAALELGYEFDFGHFWEDIACKNGPLVVPEIFDKKVGPYYRKITELLASRGIDIVSLDCDGVIDSLMPTWFNNGVNTMFPIEVGTWGASIEPWRKHYGKGLRGVGGMNKTVFAKGREAIDAEIERLRPLVDLGGYIPCPDHRIPPDAEWDLVRYYCERMRTVFG